MWSTVTHNATSFSRGLQEQFFRSRSRTSFGNSRYFVPFLPLCRHKYDFIQSMPNTIIYYTRIVFCFPLIDMSDCVRPVFKHINDEHLSDVWISMHIVVTDFGNIFKKTVSFPQDSTGHVCYSRRRRIGTRIATMAAFVSTKRLSKSQIQLDIRVFLEMYSLSTAVCVDQNRFNHPKSKHSWMELNLHFQMEELFGR